MADRVAAALVGLAGMFVALQCAVREAWVWAVAAALLAGAVLAAQAYSWTWSRRRGPCTLERDDRGRLWWSEGGKAPVPATLGRGSRVLGRSLWLEVEPDLPGRRRRRRAWLTAFDLPATGLRRWTVVLPSSGREACS